MIQYNFLSLIHVLNHFNVLDVLMFQGESLRNVQPCISKLYGKLSSFSSVLYQAVF